ncbi:hypothetical protein BS78_06G063000 [Paspalum vaginatum]|nr:hypothetical protein BS78_06G063000 [Paspalum vaginatum]
MVQWLEEIWRKPDHPRRSAPLVDEPAWDPPPRAHRRMDAVAPSSGPGHRTTGHARTRILLQIRARYGPIPSLPSTLPLLSAGCGGRPGRAGQGTATPANLPSSPSRLPPCHCGRGSSRFQPGMTLRIVGNAKAPAPQGARPAPLTADAVTAAAAAAAGPDHHHHDGAENGSKDESFFEARPWLDSDSEDDFHSVRGDFTPSRGSTPDHPRATFFSGWMPVDRSKPPVIQKKQRLLDLLQEKQHYDDEDDSVTDVSSELEDSAVHPEEHVKASRSHKESERSSWSGCFPILVWKHRFTNYRKKRKEHKDKVN